MLSHLKSLFRTKGPMEAIASTSITTASGNAIDREFYVHTSNITMKVNKIYICASTKSAADEDLTIRKVTSGTAIASGVALTAAVISLDGLTNNTNTVPALTTTAASLFVKKGDRLALDFTGSPTSMVAAVSVELVPASV
jgi:hypothetical protein